MATAKKTTKKASTKKNIVKKNKELNYLTKRILNTAAKTGFKKSADNTMRIMGFNVIVHQGWVVKKHRDGRITKIKKLDKTPAKRTLVLD
jgi:hypothetical protein